DHRPARDRKFLRSQQLDLPKGGGRQSGIASYVMVERPPRECLRDVGPAGVAAWQQVMEGSEQPASLLVRALPVGLFERVQDNSDDLFVATVSAVNEVRRALGQLAAGQESSTELSVRQCAQATAEPGVERLTHERVSELIVPERAAPRLRDQRGANQLVQLAREVTEAAAGHPTEITEQDSGVTRHGEGADDVVGCRDVSIEPRAYAAQGG